MQDDLCSFSYVAIETTVQNRYDKTLQGLTGMHGGGRKVKSVVDHE